MVKLGAIISVEVFFGKIFQHAEDASGQDAIWGFSDRKGLRSLRHFVLSLLPKNLGSEIEKAVYFAVRDLRKAT